jgi:hypothetical protein
MAVTKISLDVCCLQRPFDDQSQARVRLESEAVILILAQFERGLLHSRATASRQAASARGKSASLDPRGDLTMMTQKMTLELTRVIGLEVLGRELGSTGLIRFLQTFEKGQGNYPEQRTEFLPPLTAAQIAEQIAQRRERE